MDYPKSITATVIQFIKLTFVLHCLFIQYTLMGHY